MAKTALELSPEEWKQYSPPVRTATPETRDRWHAAWELIPQLVKLLREDFGATTIKVFGSAINVDYFSLDSDIDIAAWDIPIDKYFLAVLAVDEFTPDFRVDLVDPAICRPKLLQNIEEEGIEV
ncbi:nucleotidyltransferase domain-containing protein [Leptothoe spongobia TAU-MAC 1115]|uniref:Nucleotidyltransferase domain-containing protein n=2 Tax=Leptothoe TaxID=2651725 RepID=A0A947GKA2_9CYAN|nr:nucleotidyltransferase domain-containing protein [Leptothoe spongobia TAU-MAC 1115]